MDDPERILERLVQLGDVIAVDEKKHAARVKFPATGIISGWLKVIDARPYAPDYDEELAETLDREPESEVVRWKENEDTDKEDLLYIETEAKGRIGFDLDSELVQRFLQAHGADHRRCGLDRRIFQDRDFGSGIEKNLGAFQQESGIHTSRIMGPPPGQQIRFQHDFFAGNGTVSPDLWLDHLFQRGAQSFGLIICRTAGGKNLPLPAHEK